MGVVRRLRLGMGGMGRRLDVAPTLNEDGQRGDGFSTVRIRFQYGVCTVRIRCRYGAQTRG